MTYITEDIRKDLVLAGFEIQTMSGDSKVPSEDLLFTPRLAAPPVEMACWQEE